jgi:DNA invertase Pin-like site-specific DNA recombinase
VNLDGYIRVSRVAGRSGDSFISPGEQRQKISDWAKSNGYTISNWYEELDKSGSTTDRPMLMEIVDRIEKGATSGIVVAKLDRFSRTLLGSAEIIRRIEACEGEFFSVSEGSLKDSQGRLYRNILLAVAEGEWDRVKLQWVDARRNAINRGLFTGPHVPFGYTKPPEFDAEGKKIDDRQLVPNKDAEGVKAMFAARVEGRKVRQIAEMLNDAGYKPVRSQRFTAASVHKMLRNRTYLGEVRSGQFVRPDSHEPLVGPAVFEFVQPTPRAARSLEAKSLLAGLLRCSGCRHVMVQAKGRRDAAKFDYRCRKDHHESGLCEVCSIVKSQEVEQFVVKQFLKKVKTMPKSSEFDDARRALDAAEHEYGLYIADDDFAHQIGHDRWKAGIIPRKERVDQARIELSAAAARERSLDLGMVGDDWQDLPVGEQREFLSTVIDGIFIRPGEAVKDRVKICWTGEMPEVPMRGHSKYVLQPYSW